MVALYSIVLVGLDNIQDELENPYDGIGPDDLHLDIAEDYINMIAANGSGAPRDSAARAMHEDQPTRSGS